MAYGNYAPFYRPNYYPTQQPMQTQGAFDASMQYGQPFQQPMQASPMQNPQAHPPVNDMIWVLGEVEATSYPVAPNNTVVLWDKDQPTVFIKSVNAQGVPAMRILDYTERTSAPQKSPDEHVCKCGNNFVSKEAFKALEARFNELTDKFNALTNASAEEEDNGNG